MTAKWATDFQAFLHAIPVHVSILSFDYIIHGSLGYWKTVGFYTAEEGWFAVVLEATG